MLRKTLLNGFIFGVSLVTSAVLADAAPNGGLSADRPVGQFYGGINPFYGGINPFYGGINPFYGGINPFYGGINPFYGNISPFWGDNTQFWGPINPFYGGINPFYGPINPFWGNISPFTGSNAAFWGTLEPYWQSAGPQWGSINLAWAKLQAGKATDYSSVQQQLQAFIANAQTVWTPALSKTLKKTTFADGFATPLLAKYGIDLSNPSSLANVDAQTRSAFFMAWYDGLMAYSGAPRVDWWMGAVHWSPELTQIQDTGSQSSVGVLDAYFTKQNNNVQTMKFVGGYKMYVNDHGAAVASLIAAQPSAGNVMGIAPNSQVLLYNPFDATGTASWTDVAAGIDTLYANGAYVINASLGVPGTVLSDEWANILTSPLVNRNGQTMVLVKAAGNEGVAQSTNINWIGNQAPDNLILVGSVGPDGTISPFSNTPGNACILINGACQEQNKLMYHFIVAPGENILVSDNNGGTTRMTGTSFAAPLVSGAITLLQDRWPWLKQHPAETVQIIFQSARDLGAPGVDPVYGWGELDVTASQSPLNYNNLFVYQPGSNSTGIGRIWSTASLKASLLDPGQLSLWQQTSAYIVAFENIGTTFRDFEIPLSSLLAGKKTNIGLGSNPFQTYLYQRLIDWAKAPSATGFESRSQQFDNDGWTLSLTATLSSPDEMRSDGRPIHQEFAATNRSAGIGLRFGEGNGSHALNGAGDFLMRSDLDPSTGGVNPILGLASGGVYGSADITVFAHARVSFGFTQKRDDHTIIDPTFGPVLSEQLSPNRAFASVVAVEYDVAQGIKLNASHTALREADGLLGSQGSGLFNMVGGTHSEATTIGATIAPSADWTIFGSATTAHSAAPQFGSSMFSFTAGGLTSTAYELAATKSGLFAEHDQMRLSIAQPLHIESGSLQYQSQQVVDRQTGALGLINESWSVSGRREVRMEALYALPLWDGRGEVRGYGLVDLNPQASTSKAPELAIGAQFRVAL